MVKYVVDNDDIWHIVERYEHYISQIKGYRNGDEFFILRFNGTKKPQLLWVGRSLEELKLQLKTERARHAIDATCPKLPEPTRQGVKRA